LSMAHAGAMGHKGLEARGRVCMVETIQVAFEELARGFYLEGLYKAPREGKCNRFVTDRRIWSHFSLNRAHVKLTLTKGGHNNAE